MSHPPPQACRGEGVVDLPVGREPDVVDAVDDRDNGEILVHIVLAEELRGECVHAEPDEEPLAELLRSHIPPGEKNTPCFLSRRL